MEEKKLTLELVTPDRQVLHDQVDSVQLPGLDGELGILPGHAPLLTELGTGVLSLRKGTETLYATALGGFAEVLGDRVIVLAERSELAEEIDLGRAEAAHQRALKRLQEKTGAVDFQRAQLALQRSLIRLQVAPRTEKRRTTGPLEREISSHRPRNPNSRQAGDRAVRDLRRGACFRGARTSTPPDGRENLHDARPVPRFHRKGRRRVSQTVPRRPSCGWIRRGSAATFPPRGH